jgi:putative transposase
VRQELIDTTDALPIARQCALLGISRSSWYYQGMGENVRNLELMRLIDEEYMRHPFLGTRKMRNYLRGLRPGYQINRKRVQRLMRQMGIEAIYPKPNLSRAGAGAQKYPYLLRGLEINRPDMVWCTDITYIRLAKGFVYLVAVMDWHSRYVIAWELSNTLDSDFCVSALTRALLKRCPEMFNSDQGVQFTSTEFTDVLKSKGIAISMDGRGRAMDNIFIERLWRTVKYEDIYLHDYRTMQEACEGIKKYFEYYNDERQHQSMGYKTPREVYLNLMPRMAA